VVLCLFIFCSFICFRFLQRPCLVLVEVAAGVVELDVGKRYLSEGHVWRSTPWVGFRLLFRVRRAWGREYPRVGHVNPLVPTGSQPVGMAFGLPCYQLPRYKLRHRVVSGRLPIGVDPLTRVELRYPNLVVSVHITGIRFTRSLGVLAPPLSLVWHGIVWIRVCCLQQTIISLVDRWFLISDEGARVGVNFGWPRTPPLDGS